MYMHNVIDALQKMTSRAEILFKVNREAGTPLDPDILKAKRTLERYSNEDVTYCNTCKVEVTKDRWKDHEEVKCDLQMPVNYAAYKFGRLLIELMAEESNGSFEALVTDGMIEEMNRTHRALQETIMHIIYRFIAKYAEFEDLGLTDGRNEIVVQSAKRMREVM